MHSKSLVVLVAAFLLVGAVAPAAASDGSLAVSVDQHEDGSATATVTHNGTAVENATVDVNATDGNYSAEGTYETDANGTVSLSAPEENVTIDVFAEYDNDTANTTATLVVTGNSTTQEFDSFGSRVSWFVHQLLGDRGDTRGIGEFVSEYVVANNPGNAPDHAGSSAAGSNGHGPGNGGNTTAVHGGNGDNGPPDHAGSNGNGKAKGHGE